MANEYVVGQVILLKDLITDPVTGNPVDDASDVVTVYKPDQVTVITPSVTHGTTGNYSAQITLDQQGWWTYAWRSAGAGAGAGVKRFFVSPVP